MEFLPVNTKTGRVKSTSSLVGTAVKPIDFSDVFVYGLGEGGQETGITQLVVGKAYIDVVFAEVQPSSNWTLSVGAVINTVDANPLNIWPGIITSKRTTGFRLQLNGAPDTTNYYLYWTIKEATAAIGGLATTYLLSGPLSGSIGVPATFTVELPIGSAVLMPVTVTPSDSGGGGTFSPTSVELSTDAPTATFTYTPATGGAKTISTTNDGELTDPDSRAFTPFSDHYLLSGPSSGTSGVPSTNFTVALPVGGAISGTMIVTPSDGGGGGTFAPSTVSLTTGAPSATFTYTPASAGAKTISVTNNRGLTNPGNLTYTATASGPVILDHFTDADGTGLPSHTMDIGPGWTRFEGTGANQMAIQTNKVESFQDAGAGYSYQTESGLADCVIAVATVFGSTTYCKIIFRYVNATNYWMLSVNSLSGTGNVELIKVVAGANTTVSTANLSITLGTGVFWTLTLSGTSISASVDTANVSTTDAFNQSATKHGIGTYQPTANGCFMEDFSVT